MSEQKHPVTIELEKHQAGKANMLMPSIDITGLSDMHKPVIDMVKLSPNPADGDVYKQDGKMLITGTALAKLAVCAGIVWDPNNTKRSDNHSSRDYISFQAVGGIRKMDGQVVSMIGNDDMDFINLEEDLKDSYSGKAGDRKGQAKEDYIEYCVNRDMRKKRKHGMALVESGAKNRVIRKLLCLKGGYTVEELSKPFVVVRVSFQPDFNDPATRRQFITASINSMNNVYGGSSPAQLPAANETIEVQAEEIPGKEEPENNGPDPAEEFKLGDDKSQVRMLETLIAQKAYKFTQDGFKVENLSEERKLELFTKLLTLMDAPKAEVEDDDLPF